MTPKQLAADLRINLFADRGTDLKSAIEYSHAVFNTLETGNSIAARTAMHVVLNTVANILDEMLDPADNPATGTPVEPVHLMLDRAALDQIIDARIEQWMDDNESMIDNRVESWMEDNFDPDHLVNEALQNVDFEVRIR